MRQPRVVRALLLSAVLATGIAAQNAVSGVENGAANGPANGTANRAARPSTVIAHVLAGLNFDPGSRTQRFRYDPEVSYTIVGLPGVPTDIQLAPGEHVTGFALGDTVQWVVEELQGHIFIKPLRSDLFTAGTLVTDQHSYQLTLKSGHPRDDWMQRVSWTYPDLVVLRRTAVPLPHGAERIHQGAVNASHPPESDGRARQADDAGDPGGTADGSADGGAAGRESGDSGSDAARRGPDAGKWFSGLDPKQLNFDYQLSGDGAFRPMTVFDDGHAVWLRMPVHASLPALFQDSADGVQLIHYAVRGDWLVVPRLAARFILKLGRNEVRIDRMGGASRSDRREEDERERFWR